MSTRVRNENQLGIGNHGREDVRKWQVAQAGICKALMDSLVEQVIVHRDNMGGDLGSITRTPEYEQVDGASNRQVKEDVKRLRRELLLLAKSYGWSYGH